MLVDAISATGTLLGYAFLAVFAALILIAVSFDVRRGLHRRRRRRAQRRALRRERLSPAALPGRCGLGLGFELGGGERRRRDVTRLTRGN